MTQATQEQGANNSLRQGMANVVSRLQVLLGELEQIGNNVHGQGPPKPIGPATQGGNLGVATPTPPIATSVSQAHQWLNDIEQEVKHLSAGL